ncbi:hypothetical protein CPB83DRAFT_283442 [Crepidotus variabilis]|uniref:Uncharacterized protein n=1 Tax=Crepidotus variabilis TaxID=179855 RepID=A0A9P6EHQ4_9AGAR|nr:hypothetical protein CPB83DRAFT_283442 [Crepidotus variabilis]
MRHPISTISHLFNSPQARSRIPDVRDLTVFSSQRSFLGKFSESHLAIIDQHHNCGFYRILPISHCMANITRAPSTLLVHRGTHFLNIQPVDKYGLLDIQKCDKSFIFSFDEVNRTEPVVIRITESDPAGAITVVEVEWLL